MSGIVVTIFICPTAGGEMEEVQEVEAIAGAGLKGDRYATGSGSWNKGEEGKRQVTFINSLFFVGTSYQYADSRRNIVTVGIELMYLIGREFGVGEVRFRGVKYCDPCERPTKLADKEESFREAFFDRGGLIAEVIEGGVIKKGDPFIPPSRK